MVYEDNKKNNIKRDENGRIVRAMNEDVYFVKEDTDVVEKPRIDDVVLFAEREAETEITDGPPAADNDFFFG